MEARNVQRLQQTEQTASIQSVMTCWTGTTLLADLITRRRTELMLRNSEFTEIPENELQELAREAVRAARFYVTEYFTDTEVGSQSRRTA